MDNREKARARNKNATDTNFVGSKKNFVAEVRKWEMLAVTKVKMSGKEDKSEQEHI